LVVSIHAPARGATRVNSWLEGDFSFNPRARAGRDTPPWKISLAKMFQSTRPRGARLAAVFKLANIFVSIHAPARGATTQ